jgi:hypothetical protein
VTEHYVTKHIGLASFILYCRPDSYVSTAKAGEWSALFTFTDPDDCEALEVAFFNTDGVAVTDARALLDCARTIKRTVSESNKSPDGVYRRED